MLAANGSIFTILAISFERYYAICKPLKAGYKCTRLRATIIICFIWVLSTILTSPILIMAKSSETIYIDGSLVYNCILETDTYWHKMYVFISMIAFFCLPLIVLMLVYWLIGRRLIRENLAMSTTTSLATTTTTTTTTTNSTYSSPESQTNSDCGLHNPCPKHHHCPLHSPNSATIYAVRKRVGSLKKAASFKSISSSLFSLLPHQSYHQISQQQEKQHHQQQHQDQQQTSASSLTNATCTPSTTEPLGNQIKSIETERRAANCREIAASASMNNRRKLAFGADKALSLDQHFSTQAANEHSSESPQLPTKSLNSHETITARAKSSSAKQNDANAASRSTTIGLANDLNSEQVGKEENGLPIRRSLANQFVHHFLHIRLMKPTCDDNFLSKYPKGDTSGKVKLNGNADRIFSNGGLRSINGKVPLEMGYSGRLRQGSELSNDDQSIRTPFIGTGSLREREANDLADRRTILRGGKKGATRNKSRFYWSKRFSVSSSSTSMQTNCTNLPSESSTTTDSIQHNSSINTDHSAQVSPRPIIHCGGADESFHRLSNRSSTKKSAHFSINTDHNSSPSPPPTCSSSSESACSANSTFSSKSPSPDPLFAHHNSLKGHLHQTNSCSRGKSHSMLTKNSSTVEEVDEEEQNETKQTPVSDETSGEITEFVTTNCNGDQVESGRQISASIQPLEDSSMVITTNSGTNVSQETQNNIDDNIAQRRAKAKLPFRKGKSLEDKARDIHHHHFHFNLRRANTKCGTRPSICTHCNNNNNHHRQSQNGQHLSEVLVVQDLSKKQQMDSRRQVVVMLAFVVACFFLLFFPYRVFTIWLILSTEDQVQSLGMETYYNLTYFSRILIYLHSAINPIAYNLISTKFRRAFVSILLCRGSSTRRHFTTEHRFIGAHNKSIMHSHNSVHIDHKKQQLNHITSD